MGIDGSRGASNTIKRGMRRIEPGGGESSKSTDASGAWKRSRKRERERESERDRAEGVGI